MEHGIVAWLVIGAIAGFLAGKVMKGSGYGIVGDIIVGLIGAFLGGLLFGSLVHVEYALIGSIVVAFVGACILIAKRAWCPVWVAAASAWAAWGALAFGAWKVLLALGARP